MNLQQLKADLGKTDIYLLDQILKDRFLPRHYILDAGCGSGRNLSWFAQNGYSNLYGIDQKASCIQALQKKEDLNSENFSVQDLKNLSFTESYFDRIICNAVLHFAQSEAAFFKMLSELWRVLKPGGIIFIRMTSVFGLEEVVQGIGNGNYKIPDGTQRFLLTTDLLEEWGKQLPCEWVEPLKTVNVNNERAMSTLVLQKNAFNT